MPLLGNAILVGQAEAVDQAILRLTKDDPPGEMMRLAMKRQAGLASRTESMKVKAFSLEVGIRDHLTSELALEFNGQRDAKALGAWDRKGAIEGNVIHVTTTIEVQPRQTNTLSSDAGSHGVQAGEAGNLWIGLTDPSGLNRYLFHCGSSLPACSATM